METFVQIIAFISFNAFIISSVWLLINWIRKKPRKVLRRVSLGSLGTFISMIIIAAIFFAPQPEGQSQKTEPKPASSIPEDGNIAIDSFERSPAQKQIKPTPGDNPEKKIVPIVKSETSKSEPSPKYKSTENIVKELFNKHVGIKSNWGDDVPRLISIIRTPQAYGGLRFDIKYRLDDNFTTGMIKFGMFNDAMHFLKELYNSPACDSIVRCVLVPHFPFEDSYGNSSWTQVAIIGMDRETAQRINWQNMHTDRFKSFLLMNDNLWLHPNFR
jgi:hypothetical protein